jgi:hypothetical protein
VRVTRSHVAGLKSAASFEYNFTKPCQAASDWITDAK